MVRFIVLCAFIFSIIPSIIASVVIIDMRTLGGPLGVQNPVELQKSFEVPSTDSSEWRKHFTVEHVSEPKEATPGPNLLSSMKLTAVPSTKVGDFIRYTNGKRIPNDRLVATYSDHIVYTVPMDVTVNLRYPHNGQGAKVTYVEIVVNQCSNVGRAQIISGGIGQHFIMITVEASNTLWFAYTARFYGI